MALINNTQSIAAYDSSPFFEKVLSYAVKSKLIDQLKIDEIINDAAEGSIQIADYFGESTHLRKNLEVAMKHMVILVSMHLEAASNGNLDAATQLLKDKPFRTLSRGGSRMLKALYSLPEDGHFNSPRLDSEREFLKKCLVNGMTISKYFKALSHSERFKRELDFAHWLLGKMGAPIRQLNELHASAEHVVRTSLLTLAYGTKKVGAQKINFPDEAGLFEIFSSIRKEWMFLGDVTCSTKFLEDVPAEFQQCAMDTLSSIQNEDVPKIINQAIRLEFTFNEIKDRQYFYIYDHLAEVSRFDKALAAEWFELTAGEHDDAPLLTLLFCAASGIKQKTFLNESEAKKAVLNIRENGLRQEDVSKLIDKAPQDEIEQLRSLWGDFVDTASPYLLDHSDEKLNEVMFYLVNYCNIKKQKK